MTLLSVWNHDETLLFCVSLLRKLSIESQHTEVRMMRRASVCVCVCVSVPQTGTTMTWQAGSALQASLPALTLRQPHHKQTHKSFLKHHCMQAGRNHSSTEAKMRNVLPDDGIGWAYGLQKNLAENDGLFLDWSVFNWKEESYHPWTGRTAWAGESWSLQSDSCT